MRCIVAREKPDNGKPGECKCDLKVKCATKNCPCKAASVLCTAKCSHCPQPGSKCCNNNAGKATSVVVDLLDCETPTEVQFEEKLEYTSALPVPCLLVTGDVETTGNGGVYTSDITQLCFQGQHVHGVANITELPGTCHNISYSLREILL